MSLDGQYPTLPEILVPSSSGQAVQQEEMVEIPFRVTDRHNILNCEEPFYCHFYPRSYCVFKREIILIQDTYLIQTSYLSLQTFTH
jgi:hypothetical protein